MMGKAMVAEGHQEDLEGQGAGPPPSWLVLQLNSQYLQYKYKYQKTWQGQFQNLFTLHYHQEDFWMGCQNISCWKLYFQSDFQ